ncbi:MAG: NAD(P)-dependent oxidoreductase [Bacteroidetes bacterium]|nr:NAD(P)-dependent oxidoreductase [Bacteroidota bacterium]
MKILVTGCAGYIGSTLTRLLLDKGYDVIGLDNLSFGGDSMLSFYNNKKFNFVHGDIRDEKILDEVLKEADAVAHLAAIVGDPACSKYADEARSINWEGSKLLFDKCNTLSNVKRFVFASTCSNYGKMEGDSFVTEESALNPVSLYAELKVKFEKYLLESKLRDGFVATALRFATVYGLSTRMRFDLTVNEFTRDAASGKELVIFGEQFWRPYCHVEDLARAVILVIESDASLVNQNVFGVGDTDENYQKKMIADEIINVIPETIVKYVQKDEDPRDYRVDFSKIKNTLGFQITKHLKDGVIEVNSIIKNKVLADPYSKAYQNT